MLRPFDYVEKLAVRNTPFFMDNYELLRSHDELRNGLICAIQEIRRLHLDQQNSRVLTKLRRVLRLATNVADLYRTPADAIIAGTWEVEVTEAGRAAVAKYERAQMTCMPRARATGSPQHSGKNSSSASDHSKPKRAPSRTSPNTNPDAGE